MEGEEKGSQLDYSYSKPDQTLFISFFLAEQMVLLQDPQKLVPFSENLVGQIVSLNAIDLSASLHALRRLCVCVCACVCA